MSASSHLSARPPSRRLLAGLAAGTALAAGAAAGPALAATVPAPATIAAGAAGVAPAGVGTAGTAAADRPVQPPLAAGQSAVSVAVPGGRQAAVYDQRGHLWFWALPDSAHRWTRIGASSYPRLAPSSGIHVYRAGAAVLKGMHTATFILDGFFTGDGDADYLAFGTGPHGWGRLAPSGGTVIATGKGSTDNRTPGLALHIQALHGLLEMSQDPAILSVADGALLPVNRYYRWQGTRFERVGDDIVNAAPAGGPDAGFEPLPDCPDGSPPDGVYNAPATAISGRPRRPFDINKGVPVTLKLFYDATRTCTLRVPFTFPVAIPMTTAAHRTRWITAPAWLLTTSGTIGDPWGGFAGSDPNQLISGVGSFRPRGVAPYFIPRRLDVTRLAATGVESPVASVVLQITVQDGVLTDLAVFTTAGG